MQRLYFHLENEQEVRFRDNDTVPEIVRRLNPDETMFIQWLLNNRYDEQGRDQNFVKYSTKYHWDASTRCWFHRKNVLMLLAEWSMHIPLLGSVFTCGFCYICDRTNRFLGH